MIGSLFKIKGAMKPSCYDIIIYIDILYVLDIVVLLYIQLKGLKSSLLTLEVTPSSAAHYSAPAAPAERSSRCSYSSQNRLETLRKASERLNFLMFSGVSGLVDLGDVEALSALLGAIGSCS